MKEATGELSMTVIVIIGAIAIVGLVTWLSPQIKSYVETKWQGIEGASTTKCDKGYYYDVNTKKCVKA